MVRLFRRFAPDDEFEDEEEDDVALPEDVDFGEPIDETPEIRPAAEIPDFALIVAAAAVNGWHMAAIVTNTIGPDYYVRAVTVRWPFVVARPTPSNRISDRQVAPHLLSPTGSTPARKLVVNWGWIKMDGPFWQLRFYIRRAPKWWLPGAARATVRLTLKESASMRRRIVVPVKANSIDWKSRASAKSEPPPDEDETD